MRKKPIIQDVEDAIEAAGGSGKVARKCRVSVAAVSQWKHAGIPEYRLQFLKLCWPKYFKNVKEREL